MSKLITEEKQHLKKAVQAAEDSGPTGVAREAVAHAKQQVDRAVTISHYEQVLDAALRNLDLDLLFPELLGRIRTMLEADEATVFLLDEAGTHLYARASVGLEEAVTSGLRIPVGQGAAGAVIASRTSQTLYELDETTADRNLVALGIKSLVSVPIVVGDKAIGVLTVGCISGREFVAHEVRLLEVVAERVGMALERARILAEVTVERERAQRASRFKTTLLHMASHDIRTPLTAITLQLRVLKMPDLAPEARAQGFDLVERSLHRLELMLDDFLDLARAEAGKLSLQTNRFDLLPVAQDVVSMFSAQAARKGVRLHVEGESVTLEGDERRLTQVLVNIVSNAIRYTPQGSIQLRVGHAPGTANVVVDSAQLVLLDTGKGMTPEQLQGLFQPFGQVHPATEGTGLGLHLAKVIVDAHGGSIRVESPGTGQGTSVIVQLPLRPAPAQGQAAEVAQTMAGDSALAGPRLVPGGSETAEHAQPSRHHKRPGHGRHNRRAAHQVRPPSPTLPK